MGFEKKGRAIVAAFLAVCLAVAGALGAATFASALEDEVCSVTLAKPGSSGETVALGTELTANLYYVADWDPESTFKAEGSFTSLQPEIEKLRGDKATAKDWEAIATAAANLVKTDAVEPAGTIVIEAGSEKGALTGIESGLYLVVVDDAQDPYTDFSSRPALVPVGKGYLNSEQTKTDVEVALKLAQTPREGGLTIVKTLAAYDASAGTAPFVFSVVATRDGETVYDNVHTLFFSAPGTQTCTIEGIPAGAEVTVTEVYSGASYVVSGASEQRLTIEANQLPEVAFENSYDEDDRGGHGIENRFSYRGEQDESGNRVPGGDFELTPNKGN